MFCIANCGKSWVNNNGLLSRHWNNLHYIEAVRDEPKLQYAPDPGTGAMRLAMGKETVAGDDEVHLSRINHVTEDFVDQGDTSFATKKQLCETILWLWRREIEKENRESCKRANAIDKQLAVIMDGIESLMPHIEKDASIAELERQNDSLRRVAGEMADSADILLQAVQLHFPDAETVGWRSANELRESIAAFRQGAGNNQPEQQ